MIDFYFVFFSDNIIVIALFTVWKRISACVQWSSAASSVIEFVYILILTPVDEERLSPPYYQNKQSRHPRGLTTSSFDQNISK